MRAISIYFCIMLSSSGILEAIDRGDIVISPFHAPSLNPNSYDLHLAPTLLVFKYVSPFDFKVERVPDDQVEIPFDGYLLSSNYFYLATTAEYTETYNLVPKIRAKSSSSRCGLDVTRSGGFGDVAYKGHWTMAIKPAIDVIVYPYMPICQIYYESINPTQVNLDYQTTGRYNNEKPIPMPFKPKKELYWEKESFIDMFKVKA